MAAGIGATAIAWPQVRRCGDAHLVNRGMHEMRERSHVFDINDFDDTALGPFGWDVERSAAGVDDGYDGYSSVIRALLNGYRFVHIARRVVGVGGVGTRARITLFTGRDEADPRSWLPPSMTSVTNRTGERVV